MPVIRLSKEEKQKLLTTVRQYIPMHTKLNILEVSNYYTTNGNRVYLYKIYAPLRTANGGYTVWDATKSLALVCGLCINKQTKTYPLVIRSNLDIDALIVAIMDTLYHQLSDGETPLLTYEKSE